MYQVSETFLNAMNSFIVQPVLKGTVGEIEFTHEDILENSFRCCNQCVTVNDVKIGGVFVGELNMTLLKSVATTRGDWYGKKITCEYGLVINGEGDYIPCPSYEYTINEATWTEQGLKIVAYDNMLLLDKIYSNEQSSGKPWNWLQYVSAKTGIGLGLTQADVESMPNGTKVIALFSTDNIETYRDVVSYLASVLGGFATIDRQGKLVIRQFDSPVVAIIDAESRFAGCSFSDYTTTYTGLSVVNTETNETIYIHVNPDDGLTMNLGNNPFMQYGTESNKSEMRNNILFAIQNFKYVPFKATLLGCCAYDLGDCIKFVDGIAGESKSCIMSYDFGLNDYGIAGFGENPALESAQSKSDKNIAGLSKQQSSEHLAVTNFTNIGEVGISDEWTKIGGVAFYVEKEQTVLFHGVSKHNLDTEGTIRYKYVLNDIDVDFIHECQYDEGIDTTTLFLPFVVPATLTQRLDIYVQSDDAIGTVENLDMRGAILGAGVIGATWDGTINIIEAFNLALVGCVSIPFAEGGVDVSTQIPTPAMCTDLFGLSLEGVIEIPFSDELRIITAVPIYDITDELGDDMFTESGDYIVTE